MTFSNISNTRNHSIIQSPHKPGAIQDTPLLPPARIGQNSAKSLCHPGDGENPFRVIRIKETGVEDGSMCRLSNIRGSDRGFQATVEDESLGRKTMKLEMPESEGHLDVNVVKHNLGAGRYKAKTFRDHEGEHICQLRENVGLIGGGEVYLPPWWNILKFGNMLEPVETVQEEKRSMNRQDCFKALALDPENCIAYFQLGSTLNLGETVQVGGQEMNRRACYVKALELGSAPPSCLIFMYLDLGLTLKPGETVDIGGLNVTRQDCFLKVLALDPENDIAYFQLGSTLNLGETVQVGGREINQRACYVKTVELNPENDIAYLQLSATLNLGETVQVGGQDMTRQDCFLKALELNDPNGLSAMPEPEKTVKLDKELRAWHLESLESHPENASAYFNLGAILKPGEKVHVGRMIKEDGRYLAGWNMTQQACFLKALELDPKNASAYYGLGFTLKPGETVQVGGQEMNQRACYLKALELDPHNQTARASLRQLEAEAQPGPLDNEHALQVISNQKQLTNEELKTWADKIQTPEDAMLAIQAVMVATTTGHLQKNETIQDEVSAILTAAQHNIEQSQAPQEQKQQQLQLVEYLARRCLSKNVGLLNNVQYQTLRSLIGHSISIEHLNARINETQEQIQKINTRFQEHVFNVQDLADMFQNRINHLETNQHGLADKIIEIGKRMRNIRIASSVINAAQAAVNLIPFVGPVVSSLGAAAYNAGVAAQTRNVLVGLHELKAGLSTAAAVQPDTQDITMGDVIPAIQETAIGQLKLSTVLDQIHEQYIYDQAKKLEEELKKNQPAPALENPQLTTEPDQIQAQQDNVSHPGASSSHQSSEEMIPDADPQFAVTHEDIQAHQSTQEHDAASVVSSGLKTEDEENYDNILMSAIKNNENPKEFLSLLNENIEYLNRSVPNKKGTDSAPLDFSVHYGREELANILLKKKAQSARNDTPRKPLDIIRAARKNKDLYDDEGRRKS